ncbi:MAG: 4-(cytidine 5'-diphospho)-2-C-methyl-D-erythritol kinase [Betaproteobacteria bacterium]|nr:4-(cytidine 5'-diphospho)-2-C-methyl-D-erythritol kinase [Betaproteobacteria bacterium]
MGAAQLSAQGITVPAPAKLNLFLHVTGRRADGYHLLQTLFVFIDLADQLTISVRADGQFSRIALGYADEVAEADDLVMRAARMLQQEAGTTLGANIRIEKRLPMGGGLGGGSSDAASTLLALHRLWGLHWPRDRLATLGLRLGADVPVFVHGHSAWAEGVGEILQPVDVESFFALLVMPPRGVPTPMIFRDPELTRNSPALKMASFPAGGLRGLAAAQKQFLAAQRNDLQPVACRLVPEVTEHLAALDQVSRESWFGQGGGISGARMSGSGACVFALFDTEEQARTAQQALPSGMKSFVARGLNQHPLHGEEWATRV